MNVGTGRAALRWGLPPAHSQLLLPEGASMPPQLPWWGRPAAAQAGALRGLIPSVVPTGFQVASAKQDLAKHLPAAQLAAAHRGCLPGAAVSPMQFYSYTHGSSGDLLPSVLGSTLALSCQRHRGLAPAWRASILCPALHCPRSRSSRAPHSRVFSQGSQRVKVGSGGKLDALAKRHKTFPS